MGVPYWFPIVPFPHCMVPYWYPSMPLSDLFWGSHTSLYAPKMHGKHSLLLFDFLETFRCNLALAGFDKKSLPHHQIAIFWQNSIFRIFSSHFLQKMRRKILMFWNQDLRYHLYSNGDFTILHDMFLKLMLTLSLRTNPNWSKTDKVCPKITSPLLNRDSSLGKFNFQNLCLSFFAEIEIENYHFQNCNFQKNAKFWFSQKVV